MLTDNRFTGEFRTRRVGNFWGCRFTSKSGTKERRFAGFNPVQVALGHLISRLNTALEDPLSQGFEISFKDTLDGAHTPCFRLRAHAGLSFSRCVTQLLRLLNVSTFELEVR